MKIVRDFVDAIGHTPLIRLRRLSDETGCEILGKAEFMNPGGSVKDRAARGIILDAERRGVLAPGGTVVEGTAGNTGIGLAHVCNARGYRCVIVMPDNQSPEKYGLIEALGAEVRRVKAVPYSDPNHYQKVAGRLAEELPGAIWSNQFDNTANRQAHVETTGPEIWEQTAGEIDAFVSASGTGRYHCWRFRVPEIAERGGAHRAGRSARQFAVRVHPERCVEVHRQRLDHRRHRHRFVSRPTCRGPRWMTPCTSRDVETVRYVYRLLREEGLFCQQYERHQRRCSHPRRA